MIESAEFLTRGDIGTCAIQYGQFCRSAWQQYPGRSQFRLLVWGVKQRLAAMPHGKRPKVLVFGESLGAWSSSRVMYQGIRGFDHYGIDRQGSAARVGQVVLQRMPGAPRRPGWRGPPGSSTGTSSWPPWMTPPGNGCGAVVLMHDNDPIGALSPDLLVSGRPG